MPLGPHGYNKATNIWPIIDFGHGYNIIETHIRKWRYIKNLSIELVVATHVSPPCESLHGYFFSTMIPIDIWRNKCPMKYGNVWPILFIL